MKQSAPGGAVKRNRRRQKDRSETTHLGTLLIKLVSKSLLVVLVVVVLLTLVQCSVKKPESPQWITTFNLPMVNRTYGMEELVGKIGEESLAFDSLGNLSFSFTEPVDTVTLSDNVLSTDNMYFVTGKDLGVVDIDPPPTVPVAVGLFSIVGLASPLSGDSANLSAAGFNLTNGVSASSTFSEASVDSGGIWAVVGNNLGVSLDSIVVQVYDLDSLRSVAVDTFPVPLSSGLTDSVELDLNGKEVSDNLRLLVFCYTPGGLVDSASTRSITSRISFSDRFTVSYAMTTVPSFSRQYVSSVALNEPDQIDSAGLTQGNVHITLSNETFVPADLVVTLVDIYDNGTPVSAGRTVAAGAYTVIDIPLAGMTLIPSGPPDSQLVDIRMEFISPGSGSFKVPIRYDDQFTLNADMTGLEFDYVSGFFTPKVAAFDSLQQNIDVSDGFDSLQFANAVISITVDNHFSLSGDAALMLIGDNGKSLNLSGPLDANAESVITRSDAAVADFLFPMPGTIDIAGSATLAGGGEIGTITNGDFMTGQFTVFAPLEVIVNATTIETEFSTEEIDQNDIESITDHVQEARFVYTIDNHLPIGASVNILFGPDSATLLANPELVIEALEVGSAPFGSDGLATGEQSTGSKEIILDEIDVQILKNPTLYIAQQISLESSGGQTIKFSPNDYLSISGRIEVQYYFDGDF